MKCHTSDCMSFLSWAPKRTPLGANGLKQAGFKAGVKELRMIRVANQHRKMMLHSRTEHRLLLSFMLQYNKNTVVTKEQIVNNHINMPSSQNNKKEVHVTDRFNKKPSWTETSQIL